MLALMKMFNVSFKENPVGSNTDEFNLLRLQSQINIDPSRKITVFIHSNSFMHHEVRVDGIKTLEKSTR